MLDVLILGGGVAGNLGAAYLRQKMPDLRIAILNRNDRQRPIVGESLIEVSTSFIREIGLSSYLIEKHFPKYGLTYYYKLHLDKPADRTYIVDESPTIPPFPSFQINRFTFDRDLAAMNAANGVEFEEGWAVEVMLGERGHHTVTVEDREHKRRSLVCRWLIDASGRNRVLGRHLNLHYPISEQKDVFWFRLRDYNPAILSQINAIKKTNGGFDSYFCTHHFFGKGNWIWCIPIRSEDSGHLMSVGITYRPDIYPYRIRSVPEFIEHVAEEHTVVADLVKGGQIADVNYYSSYMYEARQRYSKAGWFIIGDAADTVDPLYSLGISFISLQVRQVAACIRRERQGRETREFTADLDAAFETLHHVATREITRLYQWMHDPYCCHLLMHVSVVGSFHLAFPLIAHDYVCDPIGARLIRKVGAPEIIELNLRSLRELILKVSKQIGPPAASDFLKVQTPFSINYRYFERLREEDMARSIAEMYLYFARLRYQLMIKGGWRTCLLFRQYAALAADAARAAAIYTLFRGKKVRDSGLVRWLLAASKD